MYLLKTALKYSCKHGRKVKKELEDGEITIEYNNVTRNQVHHSKAPKIESKISNNSTIQPENKLLHKTPQIESIVLSIKTVQSEDKLLQKTPKLETKILHNKNTELTEVSTETPTTACTNIVPSDITKENSKESSLKIQIKNRNDTVSKNNVSNLQDRQTELPKSNLKTCNEPPNSSYTRPVHSLPFSGARFLHSQVHSNSVLQLLLKDIVTLNNEKDLVDEDAISQEIARLRSKNNLPSLDAEILQEIPINLEFDDSDYSEDSEYECSNYDHKDTENYGKDSGYDNESQYSESLEDDNKSEVQENNLGNDTEKSLVIAEPEYIDLDNYYGIKKRKLTAIRGSLVDIRTITKNSQYPNPNNGLTCSICNRTLKSKRAYRNHTKNGTGCVKKSDERRLFNCIGNCKFFGTKEEFLTHKKEKHQTHNKNPVKEKPALPIICNACAVPFYSKVSFDNHNKSHVNQKRSCLFCDFVCDNLTEYNLHISNKHSKRVKQESSSSDSDSFQIIEIDDDD